MNMSSSTSFFTFIMANLLAFSLPQVVVAETIAEDALESSQVQSAAHLAFKRQSSSSTKLDYDYLDYILSNTIFYLGPSDRIRRVNSNKLHNGRQGVTVGHDSPYRMEGSRIYLKKLPARFDTDLAAYREDLEQLIVSLPISSFSENEQLAFWFNLHNVSLLEIMSTERRARYTTDERYGPNDQALHNVKFINIGDVKFSLRDIREKIVYQHWDDPRVIYGFFLGDVGGPSLQNEAFNGDNVYDLLDSNANEFVNSLRGFEVHKGRPQVSVIYADTYSDFFPDFETDLRSHFEKYMRPEVYQLVEDSPQLNIAKYEYRIASIGAGRSAARIRSLVTQSIDPNTLEIFSTPEEIAGQRNALGFLFRDYVKKRERLKELGLLENEVTIEDIETEDNP